MSELLKNQPNFWQTNGAAMTGGLISGSLGLLNNWLTNKYNQDMANLQNQFNIDMWKMNNEYNSPASQIKRLKEAGLSPNLAYGSVSPGNSSSAPVQSAPGKQSLLNNFQNAFNVAAQVGNLQLLAEKVKQARQETLKKSLFNTRFSWENTAIDRNYGYYDDLYYHKRYDLENKSNILYLQNRFLMDTFNYRVRDVRNLSNYINAINQDRIDIYRFRRNILELQNQQMEFNKDWWKTDKYMNFVGNILDSVLSLGSFFKKRPAYNNYNIY